MRNSGLNNVLRFLYRQVGTGEGDGPSDGQLLSRFVSARDEAAFQTLLGRHGSVVWHACRRVLGDDADAEDAFQATFLVLVRKAADVDGSRSLAGWLYGVAHRVALKARARRDRRRQVESEAPAMQATPQSNADREELRFLIDAQLAELPEKYRTPLVLCYLEGKTNEQASQELGWPIGSMSKVLARGRELLGERLRSRGVAVSSALLASALVSGSATAAPPPLADATLRAATSYLCGSTAGGASAAAVALAEGVLRSMLFSRIRNLTFVLLAAVAITGVSAFLHQAFAARPLAPLPEIRPARSDVVAIDAEGPRIRIDADSTRDNPKRDFPFITLGHFPLDDFRKADPEQKASKALAVVRDQCPLKELRSGKSVDLLLVGPVLNSYENVEPVLLQQRDKTFTLLIESWTDNGGRKKNIPARDAHLISLGMLPAGDYELNIVYRRLFQEDRHLPNTGYVYQGQSHGQLRFYVADAAEAAPKDHKLPSLTEKDLKAVELPDALKSEIRQRAWRLQPAVILFDMLKQPEVRAGTVDLDKWAAGRPARLADLPTMEAPNTSSPLYAILAGPAMFNGQTTGVREIVWKDKQVTIRVDVWMDQQERRRAVPHTPVLVVPLQAPKRTVENIVGTVPGDYEVVVEWTILDGAALNNNSFVFNRTETSRVKMTVK